LRAKLVLNLPAAALLLSSALGAQGKAGDDLVGIWGSELTFGPQVRGAISLERGRDRWVMRVAGFEASAPVSGDSVRIALTGGQGGLRADIDRTTGVVRGFWVQPAGNLPAYASPIRFTKAREDAWTGVVAPVEDRFSLYLQVQRLADGTLKAVLRNPEINWNGRAPWFRIVHEGDHVAFIEPTSGKKRYTQSYDSAQRQIAFDFDGPVILRPRQPDQAVGFFPRPPSAPSYEYRVPVPRGDGWQTARAASVGLDEARLQSLVRRIATTDPATDSAPLIHSLLIARHGKLVLDEYFTGQDADLPHDLRSASKMFLSVMAGIAMDHGARFNMETPVTTLFPAAMLPATPDARRARVTVGQLLTHTSGMACDENDDTSPGNEDAMQSQTAEPDWYGFMLNVPMAHDPGTVYAYCSGGINLVGGVIARSTNRWLPDFFDRFIARPLQMQQYGMNLMPTGEGYGGGGVRMRSRDFLKFGQLYLDGGTWNGTRVVSASWVKRSTARQADAPGGTSDGFGWHRYLLKAGSRTFQEYEANGNGGQFLIVIPELDLTVVFTAGNYNQYRIWRKFRDELVPQFIFPMPARP